MICVVTDKKIFRVGKSPWRTFESYAEVRPEISDGDVVRMAIAEGDIFADFVPGRDGALRSNCGGKCRNALKQKFNKIFS